MLKFINISTNDLLKIHTIKEQGNQDTDFKGFNAVRGSRTNLVMPHNSYSVGLSSLKTENEPQPEMTGIQVIDASPAAFKSVFNLYFDKDSNNKIQMLHDKKYLRSYENAFDTVLNLDLDEMDFEVRSIIIPALHVEAIWLHKENNENSDIFTIVRSIGLFEGNKTYNRKEFYGILKDAAANYDLEDDLLGG